MPKWPITETWIMFTAISSTRSYLWLESKELLILHLRLTHTSSFHFKKSILGGGWVEGGHKGKNRDDSNKTNNKKEEKKRRPFYNFLVGMTFLFENKVLGCAKPFKITSREVSFEFRKCSLVFKRILQDIYQPLYVRHCAKSAFSFSTHNYYTSE